MEIANTHDLLDIEAVRGVIGQFFIGRDRDDIALVLACFAPEGKMFSDGVQSIGPGSVPPSVIPGTNIAISDIKAKTHVMHHCYVKLMGDVAAAEIYATVYLVVEGTEGDRLLVRGLRYGDTLSKIDGEWKIRELHSTLDWMFETTPLFNHTTTSRRQFDPSVH